MATLLDHSPSGNHLTAPNAVELHTMPMAAMPPVEIHTTSGPQHPVPSGIPIVTNVLPPFPVPPPASLHPYAGSIYLDFPPSNGAPFLTPMQQMFEGSGLPADAATSSTNIANGTTETKHARSNSLSETERLEREAEKAAEMYKAGQEDDREELSRGMKGVGIASAILALIFVIGGSFVLSQNNRALTSYQKCDQLWVWGLLFVIFEGLYLLGLFIHGCFSDESFHTKRVKSLILLVVFCMSVLFFIWGTIIINTSECSEIDYGELWIYFRVLYWFIIGVWSVVLILLTMPVILFFVLKTYMNRTDKQ